MSRDPELEDTVASDRAKDPLAKSADAETSLEGPPPVAEEWLRARIQAQLFGGAAMKIGRFEVLGSIGAGGMGVVCRARDPDLDREVAIKLLRGGTALGAQGQARLQREARAMAKLSHPNVVHVYEVGIHEGEIFVAMELVPGQTLNAWCSSHTDDPASVVSMFCAAGEGLAAAHAAGFVHRDFKPDNVIVGNDGRPRVLDFGIAGIRGESAPARERTVSDADHEPALTATGAVLGTPAFMAPEQHRGIATDERTDQFAFCVSLWAALAGEPPFEGTTLLELAAKTCAGEIRSPKVSLPPGIEPVLRRGLSVDPAARFPSMRTLLDALTSGSRERSTSRWILGIASVVGIAAVVAAWQWIDGPRDDVAAPSVDGGPAAETDAAKPLAIVQLTRTAGSGIDSETATLDATGKRLLYRVGGEVWVRDVDSGAPSPVALGDAKYQRVVFDPNGDGYVGANDDGLWHLRPNAAPERLPFVVPADVVTYSISPDGRAAIVKTRSRVLVQRLGAAAKETLAGFDLGFAAWAPDARRWAAGGYSADRESTELVVVDVDGTLLHRIQFELAADGLVWVDDQHIAMVEYDEDGRAVRCLTVDERGITTGLPRPLDLPPATVATALDRTPSGGLLIDTMRRYRDVIIVPTESDSAVETLQLSQGLEANNLFPVWLDDERLAFVTDRFGGMTLMLHDLRDGQTRSDTRFGSNVVGCAAASGRLLCATTEDDGVIFVRETSEAVVRRLGPAPRGTVSVACAPAGGCFALVQAAEATEIHAVDPETGTSERRFVCANDLHCVPERWVPSVDGKSLLVSDGTHVRRLDAHTGAVLDPDVAPVSPDGAAQSAVELRGGDIVSTQMVDADDDAGPYRVVRTRGDTHRTLWNDDATWSIRPRPSPDGRSLAFTVMAFHIEAALVPEDPCSQ